MRCGATIFDVRICEEVGPVKDAMLIGPLGGVKSRGPFSGNVSVGCSLPM